MDLRGRLSNSDFQDLLQSLTSSKTRKAPAKRTKARDGNPAGRRKFGTVGGAIVSVLEAAGSEMPLKSIHAEVERLLDGSVSVPSVTDYVYRRSKGRKPLFVRTRRGHYRLQTPY